jgi:hypothetical protein
MGPAFEEGFSESSCGFRPSRSAHDAVRAGQGFVVAGKKWVVDIDLKRLIRSAHPLRAAFGRRSPFDRLWQRWRHPRGRINALKRLGVRGRVLGMACSGLGAWVMRQALKTKTLNHYGFIIPWDFAESCK